MNHQYITAGWRRSGLYPLNAHRVLNIDQVARYRQITPELTPPQTQVHLTPQDIHEFNTLSEVVLPKLSRSTKRVMRSMMQAYYRETSINRLLINELKQVRKHGLEEDEASSHKRLKKQDDKRTFSAREVAVLRGHTEEEVEALMAAQADRSLIYEMEEE
jgi:hypothetical protein